MEDTSLRCWKGVHLQAVILAGVGLCVCACVILFMIFILHKGKKQSLLANQNFLHKYGYLYFGFKQNGLALYWESVITVRRMLLAAVTVYTDHRETSTAQIGLIAIVIFISTALQEMVKPYAADSSPEDTFPSYAGNCFRFLFGNEYAERWVAFNQRTSLNGLEGASLFMSLSLFLVAASISNRNASKIETVMLLSACFVLNVLFFIYLIYRLWWAIHTYFDVLARENATLHGSRAFAHESSLPRKALQILRFVSVGTDGLDGMV